jgi:4-hydroxybenzoate polyprenyltransferase
LDHKFYLLTYQMGYCHRTASSYNPKGKEMILYLLTLYRLDVALISFGAYAAGLVFSGGVRLGDLPIGLAISLISFNYIYSLNSIEDHHIDSINKPHRPIPSGKLPIKVAQRYVMLLLVLSVAYPFFIQTDIINLLLFQLLPLLGWAYSKRPFHLKTKVIPAMISIAFMYTTPVAIGLTSRLDALSPQHVTLLSYIFLFCLSIVPLKDIEDVEGDQMHGSRNFLALLGMSRLLSISLVGLVAAIVLVILADLNLAITVVLVALPAAIFSLIAGFVLFKLPRKRLYRSILVMIATLGLLFSINSLVFGGSL